MLLNTQNINEITDFLNTLSFNDFKNIVEQYSNKNNVNFDTQMETMVTMSLQSRLNKLGVNCTCPKCNSSLKVKNGKRKMVFKSINVKNVELNLLPLLILFLKKLDGIGIYGLKY